MLIISKNDNEVLKSIKYLFDQERAEYVVAKKYKDGNYDKVIFITDNVEDIPNVNTDILVVTNKKVNLSNFNCKSNVIVTKLVSDNNKYTKAQEEWLFRKGIYSVINSIVLNFINDNTIDKLVYDASYCRLQPTDWVFDFDSIAESYAWLSRKNSCIEHERKVFEIEGSPVGFSDSDKEINYLSEYILLAKKGMKISMIYVGTHEYIRERMKNRFFDILVRKCGDNVKAYFCDINFLEKNEPEFLGKMRDGIAIYDDCVYRDTFDSEFSLGVVDCKLESVKEYTNIFNYIKEKYSVLIVEGGEYVEF